MKTYHNDVVAFLQKLIQTPSVNGKNGEAAVVEVIRAEASKLGLPHRVIAKDNNRPNIFVGEDFKGTNELLLVAHLDTVPVGETSAWTHPPFSGILENERLYGRGAIDCKGGIAMSLYALKLLKDAGKLHTAKFVGVADEESGADSTLGLRYLLDEGLNARTAVYTYGGNADGSHLTIGHRGLVRLWVTCHGESIHSGSKEWQDKKRGSNAIDGLIDLLSELREFALPGENKYFPGYRSVLTPTLIEGGAGESIVPDRAKVLLDIRLLPEHRNDEVISEITELTKRLSDGRRTFTIEVKNNLPGVLTDPNSDIVKRALKLNKELFGVDSSLKGSGPANESYMLISRGIPTITGYGPFGANFHSANEYALTDSINTLLTLLSRLAGEVVDLD